MSVQCQHSLSPPVGAQKFTHALAKTVLQSKSPVILIVEDDRNIRENMQDFLEAHGLIVECFNSAESFIRDYHAGRKACLLVDLDLGENMSGLDLLSHLNEERYFLPAVVISGNSNLATAVETMKAGAADYVQKPFTGEDILTCIERVLAHSCFRCKYSESCIGRNNKQSSLTPREKQIMGLILAGHPSKNIAADLGLSQRTVENHRAEIMRKTNSKSIAQLVRVSLTTPWHGVGECPPCFVE